ncbi:MAG: sensor domain-containing diguanylate cyclase [Halothiobacillaceae bacterium]|nr:sensor domain-containing diguanylate cyclase [Halothiobacillaceae bacterium]
MDESTLYRERLELVLEAAGLDLWENDLVSGEVIYKVRKVFIELGYEPHEGVETIDDIFAIIHPDDVAPLQRAVEDHVSGRTERYRSEFRIRAKDGSWVWFANYGKIMDHEGRRFMGVTFNIDERKRKEDEIALINRKLVEQNELLEHMNRQLNILANTDTLTGAANRRKLMEEGETELARARRFNHPLALLIADIDHFKHINDTWGHVSGDEVIRAVAQVCMSGTRGNIDTVGRFGGEEFAILLPETGLTAACELAERLRGRIAALSVPIEDGRRIGCTVSMGVAASHPNISLQELLIQADQALYQAKNEGRNRVRCQGADAPLA